MSVTCCMNLVFLICLISVHACNARRLGAVGIDKKSQENFDFSTKGEEKVGVDKSRSGGTETKLIKGTDSKALGSMSSNKVYNEKSNPAGGVKSNHALASVSFRVPRKKRGEKHPGFNLDYSPPKTHPPSHN